MTNKEKQALGAAEASRLMVQQVDRQGYVPAGDGPLSDTWVRPEVDAHTERAAREGISRLEAKRRNFNDAWDAKIRDAWASLALQHPRTPQEFASVPLEQAQAEIPVPAKVQVCRG